MVLSLEVVATVVPSCIPTHMEEATIIAQGRSEPWQNGTDAPAQTGQR